MTDKSTVPDVSARRVLKGQNKEKLNLELTNIIFPFLKDDRFRVKLYPARKVYPSAF